MKIFAASAGGLRPKDTRGQFFLPKEGGFGAISVSSARGFLSGRSALKYKRENRNFLYQTFLFRFLGFCLGVLNFNINLKQIQKYFDKECHIATFVIKY